MSVAGNVLAEAASLAHKEGLRGVFDLEGAYRTVDGVPAKDLDLRLVVMNHTYVKRVETGRFQPVFGVRPGLIDEPGSYQVRVKPTKRALGRGELTIAQILERATAAEKRNDWATAEVSYRELAKLSIGEEADSYWEKVLGMLRKTKREDDVWVRKARNKISTRPPKTTDTELARAMRDCGRNLSARKFGKALRIAREVEARARRVGLSAGTRWALRQQARCLTAQGAYDELARVIEALNNMQRDNAWAQIRIWREWAVDLVAAGRNDEARQVFHKALAVVSKTGSNMMRSILDKELTAIG
ncbi:MAG: hypothetical protein ABH823_01815 [bacterium]